MKKIAKIGLAVVLSISFQSAFSQNITEAKPLSLLMFEAVANSEYDLVVRINSDMSDEELRSRINLLTSFDKDITIEYSRDNSGNISTLSSSNGRSSCVSDNFGYLIIGFENGESKGCMISDKKNKWHKTFNKSKAIYTQIDPIINQRKWQLKI